MTEPDPNAVDPDERKGRIEIRLIIVLVLAVVVLGGLWVAINGSPAADRRHLDSSSYVPPPAETGATSR